MDQTLQKRTERLRDVITIDVVVVVVVVVVDTITVRAVVRVETVADVTAHPQLEILHSTYRRHTSSSATDDLYVYTLLEFGPEITPRPMVTRHKVLPYSLLSVGPGADPSVRDVSSHPPGGRLPLLSDRPAVTSVASTRWRHPLPFPAHYLFIDPKRMKG